MKETPEEVEASHRQRGETINITPQVAAELTRQANASAAKEAEDQKRREVTEEIQRLASASGVSVEEYVKRLDV